jgi:hypothetical protein
MVHILVALSRCQCLLACRWAVAISLVLMPPDGHGAVQYRGAVSGEFDHRTALAVRSSDGHD